MARLLSYGMQFKNYAETAFPESGQVALWDSSIDSQDIKDG